MSKSDDKKSALGATITFALALVGDGVRIGSDLFVVSRKQQHDARIFLRPLGRASSALDKCWSAFDFNNAKPVLVSEENEL